MRNKLDDLWYKCSNVQVGVSVAFFPYEFLGKFQGVEMNPEGTSRIFNLGIWEATISHNGGKTIINHPFGNGFIVNLGMVYDCFTHTWLVVWNRSYFSYILGIIIPTDRLSYFFRGVETTQLLSWMVIWDHFHGMRVAATWLGSPGTLIQFHGFINHPLLGTPDLGNPHIFLKVTTGPQPVGGRRPGDDNNWPWGEHLVPFTCPASWWYISIYLI